jgi:hypothetical protein
MAGDYLLTLTVDGCSSAAGKTTVVVNPAPPTPVVTAPDAVPPNGSFTASIPQVPNADHVWTVTNGTVTSGQHTDQVGILANGAGLLSISVTSSDSTTHCQAAPGTTTIRVGAAAATSFRTILPCRLFDTRNGSGADSGAPILAAGETRTMAIGSRCSVPAGSIVLSVNQTVTGQTAAGDLVLFRGDRGAAPGASSIAFRPGVTRASNGMLELALDGSRTFKVFNNSAGSVHLILDVNGYFQ